VCPFVHIRAPEGEKPLNLLDVRLARRMQLVLREDTMHKRLALFGLVVAASVHTAAPAAAQQPATAPDAPAPAPTAPAMAPTLTLAPAPAMTPTPAAPTAPGVRTHDGFYLRFGPDFGGVGIKRTTQGPLGSDPDGRIAGGASGFELSIGATPWRGFVVAGTVLGLDHRDANLDYGDGPKLALDGSVKFSLVGATVDYYLNPNKGFHFGGTVGAASLEGPKPPDGPPDRDKLGGTGAGISLAAGYDWWIGDQWSLGVLGRLTMAGVQDRTVRPGAIYREKDGVVALSVGLSLLYH
jgi:hypothetical protein